MKDDFLTEAALFFHMGGYGAYIWPSYALAVLVFIMLTCWAHNQFRNAQRALKRLQDGHDS